jgi:hypothetical protein
MHVCACTRPRAGVPMCTHKHEYTGQYVILLFHSNSSFVNASQCYVIRTLPVYIFRHTNKTLSGYVKSGLQGEHFPLVYFWFHKPVSDRRAVFFSRCVRGYASPKCAFPSHYFYGISVISSTQSRPISQRKGTTAPRLGIAYPAVRSGIVLRVVLRDYMFDHHPVKRLITL